MKNVGGWEIKNEDLLVKLGLVADLDKRDCLSQIWRDAEERALKAMPTFKRDDGFFQEDFIDEERKVVMSFRYYTPASNREKVDVIAPGHYQNKNAH